MTDFCLDDYLGQRTLILGEVNAGKTTLTRKVLEALCGRGLGERIAIVDMAPEIPESIASAKGIAGVGGKLPPPDGYGVLYLGGPLTPPRLTSRTAREAIEKARQNRRTIDALLDRLSFPRRDILILNDVSLYLQAGSAAALIRRIAPAETLLANGYWGERLGGGRLTDREKAETAKLRDHFERNGKVRILRGFPATAPA